MLSLNSPASPSYYPGYLGVSLASGLAKSSYITTKAYAMFYDKIVVEWTIPASWGACEFNVYKSEFSLGPFKKINPTLLSSSTDHFVDTDTTDVSKFRSSFYVIEVKLPSGAYVKSTHFGLENVRSNWVNIRAKEVIRRESLLLRKFVGVPSLIFRKKVFGMRCPECWDWHSEKVTQDHCKVCLGTGFKDGYFKGIPSLLQYEASPNQSVMATPGIVEPQTIPAWTINYPEIDTFDLVARLPDWKIYRVDTVQTTELQTVRVRQILNLTELNKHSVEYELIKQAIPEEYQ